MSALAVNGLCLTYPGRPPVEALRSVELTVPDGSMLAVLGPSGCGKTTLLRTIAGIEPPESGEILLGDRVLNGDGVCLPPEKRAIGLVPQEGALFPHLDVARNIGFGLHSFARTARASRVSEMLDLVGLPGYERRRPHQLSGGQQQRVALARALAPSPDVVLLDEPFSALDTGLRAAIRAEVVDTLRHAGTTSMLVTHDQTEALTMADTVAVMREGQIVQSGSPYEVYRRPVDAWTAGFLGDAVLLAGTRIGSSRVKCSLGEIDLAEGFEHDEGPEVLVFCRPESLISATEGQGVDGVITAVRFNGPDLTVDLDIGSDGVAEILTARWPSSILPAAGDRVTVAAAGPVLAYAVAPI